jgi:BNR repeat protein
VFPIVLLLAIQPPIVSEVAVQFAPVAKETPNRQPHLASQGDNVAVVYGAGNTIYFASSTDRGKTFGAPVAVSSMGQLSLGMHRGPRIAYTPDGIVISAIIGEQGRGRDGDLMAWRSRDGGKTWSDPVHVNDVVGAAREGLHAMASGGKGVLFAAWLDLREKGMQIYGAASSDGGTTWSPNRLVYESPSGSVCQCCHPSVAVDASGAIFVMFRNAVDGYRDLYLARSEDDGRTFRAAEKVGAGTWKLEGCPMDGGGLAVDPTGRVATIWRRDQTVFTTNRSGPEKALGPGKNPTLVPAGRGFYAAWTQGPSVLVAKPGVGQPETVADDGAFPSMAAMSDGSVLIAWESSGAIVIRTAP